MPLTWVNGVHSIRDDDSRWVQKAFLIHRQSMYPLLEGVDSLFCAQSHCFSVILQCFTLWQ